MRLKDLPYHPRIRIIIDGEEVEIDPRRPLRIVEDRENYEFTIHVRTPDAAYRRLEAAWHGR